MVRAEIRFNELRCTSPIAASGDRVYAVLAGGTGNGRRIVRVHPEKEIDGKFGWPLTSGTAVRPEPALVLERIELEDLADVTTAFMLVVSRSTYFGALEAAGHIADGIQRLDPMLLLVTQLPRVLNGSDLVLGDYKITATAVADQLLPTKYFGLDIRSVREGRLRRAWNALFRRKARDRAAGHWVDEFTGGGARYVLDLSVEWKVIQDA